MYSERQRQGGVLSILLIVPCPIVPFVPFFTEIEKTAIQVYAWMTVFLIMCQEEWELLAIQPAQKRIGKNLFQRKRKQKLVFRRNLFLYLQPLLSHLLNNI